jgi:group I intron endonuclease
MKKIGIYKITNPEGKIYIGQSTDIEFRWEYYINHRCKGQPSLYLSFKKYGWFYHQFEIIEECDKTKLIERERYWIEHHNCVLEGLNGKVGVKRKSFIYPEDAKRVKSEKMTKIWADKKFKRELGKKIQNVQTGEIYSSCTEASIKLSISPNNVTSKCKEEIELKYLDNWKIRPSKIK